MKCKTCGSYGINEHSHGRTQGVDSDLCTVCYWRSRYERLQGLFEDSGQGDYDVSALVDHIHDSAAAAEERIEKALALLGSHNCAYHYGPGAVGCLACCVMEALQS